MSRLRVAPIVEGHGEVESVRILLDRIWRELLGGEYVEVLAPIRRPRARLAKPDELRRAVELSAAKLREPTLAPMPSLILVLLDADEDLPCVLGPRTLENAHEAAGGLDVVCVVANIEYETWFVAAAESLRDLLHIDEGEQVPVDPERSRSRKGWIASHFRRGRRYSETVDQPALTARMDLSLCRERSRSFDKLCRELEKRLGGAS